MDWWKKKSQQELSSSVPKELIQVDPSELRFPFLPNAMLSASFSVKLVNVTDNYVVCLPMDWDIDVAEYVCRPNGVILPPRSTQEFIVKRVAKKSVAQSIECDDKFILLSTAVREDFSNSEYGDLYKFYNEQSGQIWYRRDLGVVLYPAEFPDGMPHTEELIQVNPHELRFPFVPDESRAVTSSIKIVNVTDYYIAFFAKCNVTNVAEYGISKGILPPRSTRDVVVMRQAKKGLLQSIECIDMNSLYSTIVSEDFKFDDLPKLDETQAGGIWHEVKLGIRLEVDTQSHPSGFMPPTEISSSVPKELIQVDPSELRFPFLPNAMMPASSSIKLVNVTDNYVVFLPTICSENVAEYKTLPDGVILPPRSTQEFFVTRVVKKSVAQSIECDDKYIFGSTIVSESFSNSEYGSDVYKFYKKQMGQIWHMTELAIVLEPPHTETESTLGHMPLQYLKDITNNFCNERILGRGGFGVVYKGVLGTGKMVAVKKLVQSMPNSQEQFENEINILMKLKHPNIVQLLGYCYEMQHLRERHEGKFIFAWNIECLLCLECLPKGSLDKYISDASSGLDWPTRLKIIEGISYGLQYLHEQSDGPIIHLDLKPANILVDENMIAKITDFGISRLFDKKQTIQTAIIRGTFDYMPPENLRGIITPMSDIFSLGVIIMEVITGHRDYPHDIRASSTEFIEFELQKWRNVLQKEPGYTSLEIDCQQITRCIQIGLICVNPERAKRPTMKKIIDMLQGLESMDWYISNELSSQPQHPGRAAVI